MKRRVVQVNYIQFKTKDYKLISQLVLNQKIRTLLSYQIAATSRNHLLGWGVYFTRMQVL